MENYDRIIELIYKERDDLTKEQDVEFLGRLLTHFLMSYVAAKREIDKTPSIIEE